MAVELAKAYVTLIPSFQGAQGKIAQELGAAGTSGGDAASRGFRGGLLGGIATLAGPLAAAIGALGLGKLIGDSISNASDFAESATAITAVFGEADSTIQKFAAGAAASLGQSKNQALDAARTFGVFGKAAGLTGDDLAGFSTDFVTLAGDLASFNNTSPEQAIEALGAGLRGESEPLRAYGVLLDDAALKARAVELGIYDGTGALTQQQKVLASQAEIMAQTSTQQGDFARTSGGLANQQRILAAGVENLSTTFGALLLPVALEVVGFLNRELVPALEFASGVVGTVAASFQGKPPTAALGAWTEPVTTFGATLRNIFDAIGPTIQQLVPPLLELYSSFSPLSLIFKAIGPLLLELASAFAELATTVGGTLAGALVALLPTFRELSTVIVGALGSAITAILPVLTEVIGILGPVLSTVVTALIPIIQLLAGIIGQLVAAVVPLLAPILSLIAPLVQLVGAILGPLVQLLAAILEPVLGLVSALIGALIPVIQFLVTVLAAVITAIVEVITWFVNLITGSKTATNQFQAIWGAIGAFFSDLWSGIVSFATDAWNGYIAFLMGIPKTIMGFFSGVGGWLVNAGRDLIQGFIDGIKGMVNAVGDAIGGIMDFVGGFFPHSPAERGPFSGSGWAQLKSSGKALTDQFTSGFSTVDVPIAGLATAGIAGLTGRIGAAAGLASPAAGDVYVQNPFTGEYLLAKVDGRANAAIGDQNLTRGMGFRRDA